ncbi:hypothetical protein AA906_07435 [Geobacillus stearothermophilus]|nr:hypothetical protein AA906_07435 [Geobacillus stearothermophilus]
MRIFLQWFGLDTFTIQENSHFLYPLFSLCTPIFNDQVQLVVKSQKVLNWFIEQSKRFCIELITYDPANAFRLVKDLENYGFKTEVVRQGAITLSPALKDVKELFLDGKVIFNNNRLFRWYINNVKLVEDRNGNWLPTKQNRYRKIDGFMAFLNAHTEVMKRMTAPKGDGNISVITMSDLLK